MKTKIYLIALVVLVLSSCDKNEVTVNSNAQIELIKQNSKTLSEDHDSIVNKMLIALKGKIIQKTKSLDGSNPTLNHEDIFEAIEQVTGIKPVVINTSIANIQKANASQTTDSTAHLNLDVDNLNLTSYVNSEISTKYFKLVDEIIQNEEMSIPEKTSAITELQELLVNDNEASLVDIEQFYNGTEVLKGSLMLWSNESESAKPIQASSIKKAKSGLVTWSKWKQIGFVAAADAIGGLGGFFAGGFITVGGVTAWVPPGPGGAATTAASISIIAMGMCGWL